MQKSFFLEVATKCTATVLVVCGVLYALSPIINSEVFYYVSGTIFLFRFLSPLVGKLIFKGRISPEGKAVFISGCDTGFGHMLAKRLDKLGFQVFAGCLFPEGDGAKTLLRSGSSRLHVISLDVTRDYSIEDATTYVKENLGDNVLWSLVNNAGIASTGDVLWTRIETFRRMIDVNTLGTVRLTKALLPMLKESRGRIITVASLSGRFAVPGVIPYSMSKAAAIAFSEGLRLEMFKWGVKVITIEPSFHKTGILEKKQLVKYVTDEWDNAPENVKEVYGSNYIDQYIKKKIILTRSTMNPATNVISDLEEAVTALHPEYRYIPGSWRIKILFFLQELVPEPIVVAIAPYITQ